MKPMLFFLSGSLKGQTMVPEANPAVLGSAATCDVVVASTANHPVEGEHAAISEKDGVFLIESRGDAVVLVNDRAIDGGTALNSNDQVRLGHGGPLIRFRAQRDRRVTKTFTEILTDSATISRDIRSRTQRYTTFARQMVKDAVSNSTRKVRLAFFLLTLLVFGLAAGLVYVKITGDRDREESRDIVRDLADRNAEMQRRLEAERARTRALETAMQDLEERSKSDTESLRTALNEKIDRVGKDLFDLTAHAEAAQKVYRESAGGVCYVGLGIAYFDEESGEFVRERRSGPPRLGGSGPKYVSWISGSGFLIDDAGHIVTNRHVVDPWREDNAPGRPLLELGFRPYREHFFVCFPGREKPLDVIRVGASDEADVAILKLKTVPDDLPRCRLAPDDHVPESGEKMIVVGFPRGWRGLFPKLDTAKFKELVKQAPDDDGEIVAALAKIGGIQPHMTEGVLATVTDEQLIYDASTSQGGSGGPIFSKQGWVVGINTAMTQNFEAANIGVRIPFATKLLKGGALLDPAWDKREISPMGIEKARVVVKQKEEAEAKRKAAEAAVKKDGKEGPK